MLHNENPVELSQEDKNVREVVKRWMARRMVELQKITREQINWMGDLSLLMARNRQEEVKLLKDRSKSPDKYNEAELDLNINKLDNLLKDNKSLALAEAYLESNNENPAESECVFAALYKARESFVGIYNSKYFKDEPDKEKKIKSIEEMVKSMELAKDQLRDAIVERKKVDLDIVAVKECLQAEKDQLSDKGLLERVSKTDINSYVTQALVQLNVFNEQNKRFLAQHKEVIEENRDRLGRYLN